MGGGRGRERATERESGNEMLQLWEQQQLLHLKTLSLTPQMMECERTLPMAAALKCHHQREDM